MIQPADLHKVWASPDNTRLTAKQLSFRLPVHVAAKLSALCEMFPERTRTQLVGDLLASAIEQFELSFPSIQEEVFPDGVDPRDDRDPEDRSYEEVGPILRYRRLAEEHYRKLERELGNKEPRSLFDRSAPAKSDDE